MKVNTEKLPLHISGLVNNLVRDYLNDDPFFNELKALPPNLNNSAEWIAARADFPAERRSLLKKILQAQYQRIGHYSEALARQIELLERPNTFTVCTGQQLGLLLGPFYTTLKILSAISLCAELKKRHPENNFVPIFWMAGEDHDIEEIRTVHVGNISYTWETKQTGPTGRLSTNGIPELIDSIAELKHRPDLLQLLNNAYAQPNLADATQQLCHELFGEFGLLVLNPDEPDLKSAFASITSRDIGEQNSYRESRKAISHLEKRYKIQLNGRPINFFYQTDTSRERIVTSDGGFSTEQSRYHWTNAELQNEVNRNPAAFSPNALMRPLYQEFLLPNLAYFGGAAEVAYWLELKPVFDFYNIPYPALLLRNSAFVIDAIHLHRCRNAGFEPTDLIRPLLELEKELVLRENPIGLDLSEERLLFEKIKGLLHSKALLIGSGMPQAADAFTVRMNKAIERLQQKMIREAKRNESDGLRQLRLAREAVFPGGSFQERKASLFSFLIHYQNIDFIDELANNQSPLGNRLLILLED
jgi:bacillithiol biosynthesis cysteine-adding enzyme BshC